MATTVEQSRRTLVAFIRDSLRDTTAQVAFQIDYSGGPRAHDREVWSVKFRDGALIKERSAQDCYHEANNYAQAFRAMTGRWP